MKSPEIVLLVVALAQLSAWDYTACVWVCGFVRFDLLFHVKLRFLLLQLYAKK